MASYQDIMPNQTIYIRNLNDKVKKEDLKKMLYELFVAYGDVIDVVHMRTAKMRGQAFVVFEDISGATSAMRALNRFEFLGRPLQLQFSKSKSDAVARRDGTWKLKEAEKRKGITAQDKQDAVKRAKTNQLDAAQAPGGSVAMEEEEEMDETDLQGSEDPNKVLFVTQLPKEVNEMMLTMLFKQFRGFTEARLVPGKTGLAFVEFEEENSAGTAMNGLQGFKMTASNTIKIQYAKK